LEPSLKKSRAVNPGSIGRLVATPAGSRFTGGGDQDARPTRWALYHGTSTLRLKGILADNRLQTSPWGDPKIALTPARSVAEYFACNVVNGDRHDHPDDESDPVVLTIDGEYLYDLLYDLGSYSDPVWGDGECHWENEIACWDNIAPLDEVLIEVAPVPEDRWRAYCAAAFEHRKEMFKPDAASVAPIT